MPELHATHHVLTDTLSIAYATDGPVDGIPVVLLHGFPYDIQAYAALTPLLAAAGYRVIVPYLRGYGLTQFRDESTPRSGQQAALAHDLIALMDGLNLQRAILVGYDWGGRAACIVAALWPERVIGLVSGAGYNIQNIPASVTPLSPETEYLYWYQYYFHTERGRAGLKANRYALCRLLWQLWSPTWSFTAAEYDLTAAAFNNSDFVDVVIHSYRHRFGYAQGDPTLESIEQRLVPQPPITVPCVVLYGGTDGVDPVDPTTVPESNFTGAIQHAIIPNVGHNIPQEAPEAVLNAIQVVIQMVR